MTRRYRPQLSPHIPSMVHFASFWTDSMRSWRRTTSRMFCLSAVCLFALSFADAQQQKAKGSAAPTAKGTAIHITAQAGAPGKPLVHYWSKVVGAGRANEGLRVTWQE